MSTLIHIFDVVFPSRYATEKEAASDFHFQSEIVLIRSEENSMKYKIKKNVRDEFFWTLVARNGEPICVSEGYSTRENAVKAINLLKLNVREAEIVDTTVIFGVSSQKRRD